MPATTSPTPRAARQAHARVLLAAHQRSLGLTDRAYAHTVLLRDDSTLARWRSGESPIPVPVVDMLARWAAPAS